MYNFLSQHQLIDLIIGYWIFSAAVSSMPDLTPTSTSGYLWLYRFLHALAGNLTTAFGDKINALAKVIGDQPIKPMIVLALMLPLMTLSACHGYRVHPNAINTFDSVTYDTLLETQAVIQAEHDLFTKGQLPKALVPILISLEKAYNVAEPAFQFWHSAALINSANAPSLLTTLNQDMATLNVALTAMKKGQ